MGQQMVGSAPFSISSTSIRDYTIIRHQLHNYLGFILGLVPALVLVHSKLVAALVTPAQHHVQRLKLALPQVGL